MQKFRIDDLTVLELEHWVVSVRPEQTTLGALVFSLRRQCESFEGLTSIEAGELGQGLKKIDHLVRATFQADKINCLSLMMVDAQVHFHIVPRYASKKHFEGEFYRDVLWPAPPDLSTAIGQPGIEMRVLNHYREALRHFSLE